MDIKKAFVFPGQGSQYPGMGKDLYNKYPTARRVFDEADEALGFSLSKLCFEGTDEDLQRAAPLFTTAWLFDVLPRALGLDQPSLHNSEGDEVVFHEVTFPLTPAASPEAVALRLDELQELRQESSTFWNWLSEAAATRPAAESENALLWNVTMEDGSVVLGNIELKERTLVLIPSPDDENSSPANPASPSWEPLDPLRFDRF